jgi:hypothetical protein
MFKNAWDLRKAVADLREAGREGVARPSSIMRA